ncbi:MAG: trypsin-like peptidase domain-containing protein [Cytophagales bacterium]|nr:trypsin-like peptidase domain-containing protein [Armatimonadota bacterium]
MERLITRLATVGIAALALGTGVGFGLGCADRIADNRNGTEQRARSSDLAPAVFAQSADAAAPVRDAEEQTTIRVVRQVSPAVVTVARDGGLGTGVIIDKDGLILTNAHVVGEARQVQIKLKNAQTLTGRVLGTDRDIDIAVVKVEGGSLPTAPLGDSDVLNVGQKAIAIGNPLGLEQTVTTGVVSAINRKISPNDVAGFIQTDATINPGNSGGPLLNSAGQVIGINTAVLRGNGAEGLGFAVPINDARESAQQLAKTGRVERAIMGIGPVSITPQAVQQFGLPIQQGVIVMEITRGLPADRAGIRPGDIITKLDGKTVGGVGDLLRTLRGKAPGDTVSVSGIREGGRGRAVPFTASVSLIAQSQEQ